MKVKIYNEFANVFEVVDIDFDERKIYVRTQSGGEVFCIPFADCVIDEILPDPRLSRRDVILAAFREEPLSKSEADELYRELAELDQALLINPSDTCQAHILSTWIRMEEITF